MKKIYRRFLLIAGAALLFLAGGTLIQWEYNHYRTRENCQEILKEFLPLFPERSAGVIGACRNAQPAVLEVEGVSCEGILEIPCLELILPVASSYEEETRIPHCVQGSFGNQGVMILDAQSGPMLTGISPGQEGEYVKLIDVWGRVYVYQIKEICKNSKSSLEKTGDLSIVTTEGVTGQRIFIQCEGIYSELAS